MWSIVVLVVENCITVVVESDFFTFRNVLQGEEAVFVVRIAECIGRIRVVWIPTRVHAVETARTAH